MKTPHVLGWRKGPCRVVTRHRCAPRELFKGQDFWPAKTSARVRGYGGTRFRYLHLLKTHSTISLLELAQIHIEKNLLPSQCISLYKLSFKPAAFKI